MTSIDRDATLERMKSMAGCATCDNYNYVRCRTCIWNDAMNIVEEMSEVDAVPVVRCRDCCFGVLTKNSSDEDIVICENPDSPAVEQISIMPNWFCADGERRDSE